MIRLPGINGGIKRQAVEYIKRTSRALHASGLTDKRYKL